MVDATEYLLKLENTIRHAIACIDQGRLGIAIVVDDAGKLLGTITDGDIRRAMLAGMDLGSSLEALLARKTDLRYIAPVTASMNASTKELVGLMQEHSIRQIPMLDDSGHVIGLETLDNLMPQPDLAMNAVVMAGGLGRRLRPLTEDLPKPMLPVGGRPLMERIVEQLQQAGIRRVNVTTHYKPEKIIEHFGDGKSFGVELSYVNETLPLGTGGALGLMPVPLEPLLVINGDILTQVDFRAMLAYHQEHQAEMTVAVRQYDVTVPYGVVECDGPYIRQLKEKPQFNFFVNAGIYLLQPSVYQYIPNGQSFNMTDLIQWLLDAGQAVVSFPVREYWLDIGQHEDYAKAQEDVGEGSMIR